MLNACRRQRSVHGNAFALIVTVLLVLNACRRQRSVHSLRLGRRRLRRGGVLNACRRQRSVHCSGAAALNWAWVCSTPVGVKDRFTADHIGNLCWWCVCSTPVGVKDRFTLLLGIPSIPKSRVLNACRRQRSVHACNLPTANECEQCSTPVGVKDRFTATITAMQFLEASAQRLSASKIGSRLSKRTC